jgi:non-specific serine/threonine protein kinase
MPMPFVKPQVIQEIVVEEKNGKKLGLVFNFNTKNYPGFTIEAVQGDADEANTNYISKAEALDLTKFVSTDAYTEDDKLLFQQVRKLQDSEVNKYLNRNSPFSGIWENIIHNDGEDLPDETKSLITEYLHPKLKKIFEEQAQNNFIYQLLQGKPFRTSNLKEIELSSELISPVFKVLAKNDHFEIACMLKLNGEMVSFTQNECNSSLVFLYDDMMYLWKKAEDVLQAEKFTRNGNIQLSKANWDKEKNKLLQIYGYAYPLFTEFNLYFSIKPIEPTANMYVGIGPCRVEPEIFKCLKTIHRHFHIFHCINKKEKPVIAQHISTF